MNLRAQSSFGPLLQYWLFYKTTARGKVYAACLFIVAGGSMLSLEVPLYQLLFALAMPAFLAFGYALAMRPRVHLDARLPEKAVAGQAVTAHLTLTNLSPICGRDIQAEPAAAVPYLEQTPAAPPMLLAPGATVHTRLTVLPRKRGLYPWPAMRVFSLFPFGLFRTAVRGGANTPRQAGNGMLLVYPRFTPLAGIDVPINARYQPGGIALSSQVGESPEYVGNREYRPGDSTRHLHHRSWARLGKPVVKEYQEEYYCRVALVLDTFVPAPRKPGPDGFPELEAAVSLSAAVADALGRGEYLIDIFAAGPELYVFRAGRHTAHFDNVLEILSCVDACRRNPFERVAPALADELANISSVICVLLDWDAGRERLMHAAAEAGCSTKVIIVRDGPTTLPWRDTGHGGRFAQYTPAAVQAGKVETL